MGQDPTARRSRWTSTITARGTRAVACQPPAPQVADVDPLKYGKALSAKVFKAAGMLVVVGVVIQVFACWHNAPS